jgi:predicted TPR repeat methyltransferase
MFVLSFGGGAQPTGRHAHSQAYVHSLLAKRGMWSLEEEQRVTTRYEGRHAVRGLLFVWSRTGSSTESTS